MSMFLFLALQLVVSCLAAFSNYSGYELFRITPESKNQLRALNNLKELSVNGEWLEFWRAPSFVNRSTDALVGPELVTIFRKYLQANGLIPVTRDVPRLLRRSSYLPGIRRSSFRLSDDLTSSQLNQFHSHDEVFFYWFTLSTFLIGTTSLSSSIFFKNAKESPVLLFLSPSMEINLFMENIAEKHNNFMECNVLGRSSEGRLIKYIKAGFPRGEPKNALFVDAGIHAREWIAPAVALHFINSLATDEEFLLILEDIDVYVVPTLNPDGYEHTLTKDRLWRKTRSGPRSSRRCYGVDANRNFPASWGTGGISNNPCHKEIYCGPKALSEPEARALAYFLTDNKRNIKGYVALHSYGNFIIYPSLPFADIPYLHTIAANISEAILQENGEQYLYGTSKELLKYTASGASDDYAKLIGIKYSYTIELTDSPFGFLVPTSFIESTARGITKGLLFLANVIRNEE